MRIKSLVAALAAAMVLLPGLAPNPASASPPNTEEPGQPVLRSDQPLTEKSPACPKPTEGKPVGCVRMTKPYALDRKAMGIVPVPSWCIEAIGGIGRTRNEACTVQGVLYNTTVLVNGVPRVTGEANLNLISYTYSSATLPDWGHQVEISAFSGWGEALNGSVHGAVVSSGSCTTTSSSFPQAPLSPLNSWRQGEAYFTTTATAPGVIGKCKTTWTITFTNPGHTPDTTTTEMNEIRCDNATAGNLHVGCIVHHYAPTLYYSQASYPGLASHVSRAQHSGLPGATAEHPLTRTTDEAVVSRNRSLACGDAPSIPDKSCDEYPIAQSYQGLSRGGERRTFDQCSFNLPHHTGPTGASVCMITATENNAQGGLNTQFFRRWRVLDHDKFLINVF